jgi:hypothetical protein
MLETVAVAASKFGERLQAQTRAGVIRANSAINSWQRGRTNVPILEINELAHVARAPSTTTSRPSRTFLAAVESSPERLERILDAWTQDIDDSAEVLPATSD